MPLSSLLICISSSFLHLFLLSPFRLLSPAKSLANAAGLGGIRTSIIPRSRHGRMSTAQPAPHQKPAAVSPATGYWHLRRGGETWINNVSKICFICGEFFLNVTWPGCMKKGETFAASLNKPHRLMLALLGEPKADGFETGGRVFSAGLPSTRDPVCLTAELVLLKGCLKGPEPETSAVMFVWLREEQHPKAGREKATVQTARLQNEMGLCPQQHGRLCTSDSQKLIKRPQYSFNYSLPTNVKSLNALCK